MSRTSSSLKELKGLREAVLAEEKAKTQALLQNLPENQLAQRPPAVVPEPAPIQPAEEDLAIPTEEISPPPPPPEKPAAIQTEPAPAPAPAPAPFRTPVAPAAPPNRNKISKDPALIIPLTPKIQERLQRHVENARWSPAELVMELMRVTLHQGYPAIQYGGQLIAKGGTYRTFERNPMDSVLRIISGQGVFAVNVTPENRDYQHWLTYFTNQQAADPEKSAGQVCLFTLQSYLENIEDFKVQGWTKTIPTNDFSVSPSS